jgi:diguanylate cyclase (GGDEF)-like protein/PAS domain S-box-containing protein
MDRLMDLTDRRNIVMRDRLLKEIKHLSQVRQRILSRTIGFEEGIAYYNGIIEKMLRAIRVFSLYAFVKHLQGVDVYMIEAIKDKTGLERAYIFHALLSERYTLEEISTVRSIIAEEQKLLREFADNLPPGHPEWVEIRESVLPDRAFTAMREAFLQFLLERADAQKWFEVSTHYIDRLERIAVEVIGRYSDRVQVEYTQAYRSLYVATGLGIFLFVLALALIMFLNRLVRRLHRAQEHLRISAYAFEAHEAMAVTDLDGKILRVNRAFTTITGYTQDEAVGKNPNILKSGKHSAEFYNRMWRDLADNGYWRGEIYNKRKNGEIYPEQLSITAIKNDNGKITHYISHFIDISDLKAAEQEAIHQSKHDFLTQLPNRKAMMEKLAEELPRARRHGYTDALMFIDLDDFKRLNDTNGHAAGDRLLVEVARRLRESVRAEDFVARISGDEFCVMLVEVAETEYEAAEEVRKISEKILTMLGQTFELESSRVHVSASIGIKLFPDDVRDVETIIDQADAAMYKAKEQGKNRFVFFNDDIEKRMHELQQFERELNHAIENEEIVFYYQPKVSFKTGTIIGAELMVRWEHPEKGLLFPSDFLEAFENLSLMARLSELALESACRLIADPKTDTLEALSINVTAYELRSALFAQKVVEIVSHHGVDPHKIEIEILENDLIEDFDAVVENMNRLREFGIRFSIDDFGVGYSSINYLNRLPVDTLKLDRKFVQNLDDVRTRSMIRMIARFAKVFGLKTVIEGVETKTQFRTLSTMHIDCYQGFYFSRAVDRKTLVNMVSKTEKS